MKKIIFSLILAAGLFAVGNAQNATLLPLAAGDTVSNTGTVNKTIRATAGYSAIGVQPVLTKISGTVAGKIYLMVSLDGTNFIKTDSITNADQTTNTTFWSKQTTPGTYYRVQAAGSGTMSAQLRVYYVLRKHD